MIIPLSATYTDPQPYGDRQDQVFGTYYTGAYVDFDTATETTTSYQMQYDDFQGRNPPQDFSYAGEFFSKCVGTTRHGFVHEGGGNFSVEEYADSLSCGFVPDVPPSCDLTLTYQLSPSALGTNLTATSQAAHGAVEYRLDGGPAQASPTFYDLTPGPHVLTARDTGVLNCLRSAVVVVATPPPPSAPVGAPQGVDFVEQPLWYQLTAPAGAEVVLELYAESAHAAEDFTLIMKLRRRANAAGRLAFRLDTLLSPLLRAQVPPQASNTVICTAPLVNYFVRTATLAAPGRPTSFVTSPLRTALRGSLPAEHRALDYFAYRSDAFGQPPFLSWQPAGKRITAAQPEWLCWLCTGAADVLTVRRSYVRTGFASAPPLVEEEIINLAGGRGATNRLLAIPVRPRAGTDSVSVALFSRPLNEPLSPLVLFTMVPATPRSRYLHFTNSLGGFDTLRTEGRLEGTLEGTAERFEVPATPAGPLPAAERQAFEVGASRKLKLATGWLTAAQLRWLQELVFTREIWQAENGRLRPLDPVKRQLLPESDEAPLRGMLLEFDYAFAPTAYADLP